MRSSGNVLWEAMVHSQLQAPLQEIGDKEQQLRHEEGGLEGAEAEQRNLEAKRNALNDERKELWRAENDAETSIGKIHANRLKAEKKVGAVRLCIHLAKSLCSAGLHMHWNPRIST